MTVVTVSPQGSPPYEVVIGHGVLTRAAEHVGGATRVAVLASPHVAGAADVLSESLRDRGLTVTELTLPAGESAKDISVAVDCWDSLATAGFTRSDAVIGLGGGASTDLAGFVAATWLRGVRLVQVPTTTAGMVDAAIGGKTGINTPAGKNLVGSFHQPRAVIADLDLLATLPLDDHRAGLAEAVKCGFIADPAILDLVNRDPDSTLVSTDASCEELIIRAVTVKARVVSADVAEAGLREILNYGHTLGHAIERAEHYRWRHGDAVSVGMVFAAALAVSAGRLDAATAQRHLAVLTSLGLPVDYPDGDRAQLLDTMRLDKKSRADRLRFVVLDGEADPGILENPGAEHLDAAFAAVGL